jgi:hypothetical protein
VRPISNKAEFHVTYRCTLDCDGCNRASFLKEPHTEDMTTEDAEEFFAQADDIGWRPWIVLIGGEPTLHPDFLRFVEMCGDWSRKYVQVFSNQFTAKAKFLCDQARSKFNASVNPDTAKVDGAMRLGSVPKEWCDDVFVSPADFGETRPPCYQHSSIICGIAVDHDGYAPCAIGGMIDGLLGGTKLDRAPVSGRTQRLSDLFDEERMGAMTKSLCMHCGHQRFRPDLVAKCDKRKGTPMSPTWLAAFNGRK